jgi:hypothetical protein
VAELADIRQTGIAVDLGVPRAEILAFQDALEAEVPEEVRLTPENTEHWVSHLIHDGIYAREFNMLANTVVVGKLHKHSHINVLAAGEVTVVSEFHTERFRAPRVWVSEPGIKRIVYNHTDTTWITLHHAPVGTEDPNSLEPDIIAKSYEDFDMFNEQRELFKLLFDGQNEGGSV